MREATLYSASLDYTAKPLDIQNGKLERLLSTVRGHHRAMDRWDGGSLTTPWSLAVLLYVPLCRIVVISPRTSSAAPWVSTTTAAYPCPRPARKRRQRFHSGDRVTGRWVLGA